ncbi:MAG: TetR/AcrR family transcriptional regulator [Candidatus Eremiobacteraeota bacterium]|nr:TetR/AcrR family transcriptional regulator [Candidatus Eremiobacteraeota bacterium]
MESQKSAAAPSRPALEPQRRHGKQRVAELLRAGASVIAERGFDAATMAEIAARAGAPIGSLYRFFPSKDALAEALIQRYNELVDDSFDQIDDGIETLTTDGLANALLDLLIDLRGETQSSMVELLNVSSDRPAMSAEFQNTFLRHIAHTLKRRSPRLQEKNAQDMAVVLLQNMKAMKYLEPERDAGAIAELRAMTELYLRSKLGN